MVVVIGLLLAVVLPLVDRSVAEHEVVHAGDRLDLGQGLTIAPPVGWQVVRGIKTGTAITVPVSDTNGAVLADGVVTASIQVAPYDGDSRQLLDQVNSNNSRSAELPGFRVGNDPRPVTTPGGITGLVESYSTTSGSGVLAAYALDTGRGLTILVTSADSTQMPAHTAQIAQMLSSVTLTTEGAQP
ncbi:hypothetical protein ACFV6B_06185 [Streptomyces microflavus]|uniref:hypothetical protein n=1 Tax=Streptomyces microflavus TaxID=1919 RepID=UPI00366972A4